MVVVNLYAFEKTAAKPGVHFEEVIENIDIGGPSMIRSAAKNFQDVAIVTSPADYDAIARRDVEIRRMRFRSETKWRLAQKAFATTAAYDSAIASTLETRQRKRKLRIWSRQQAFPQTLRLSFSKVFDLRYGENPHQKAAMYSDGSGTGVANARQLQGKELSYNNIVDLQAAWDLAQEFEEPVCAIIKHTNPCGTRNGQDSGRSLQTRAGVRSGVGFRRRDRRESPVDAAAAEEMAKLFLEVIAAPSFDAELRRNLPRKKNLRLVEITNQPAEMGAEECLRRNAVAGRRHCVSLTEADLKMVTKRQPTPEEKRALLFAWKVCKHVKSNAILYRARRPDRRRGRRTDEPRGLRRIGAQKAVLPLKGTVAASDAFFPFPDGVEEIAKAGATAIIQPGGSVRDQEVIEAADGWAWPWSLRAYATSATKTFFTTEAQGHRRTKS